MVEMDFDTIQPEIVVQGCTSRAGEHNFVLSSARAESLVDNRLVQGCTSRAGEHDFIT